MFPGEFAGGFRGNNSMLVKTPGRGRTSEKRFAFRSAGTQAPATPLECEDCYLGLLNRATFGIYWVSSDDHLLYVNLALVQMLGYDAADELFRLGNSQAFYCDPDVGLEINAEYLLDARADATVDWKRKDGKTITVRLHGRRVPDAERDDECVEVLVEDVTERIELEKRLLQSQKFEAIGQLAGGIAHDFNNMIGAIRGWADLGIEETEAGSRLRRHFERVRQHADRAATLTRQLLAFARRQILEPRDVDLNQTAVETLSLLEKVIGTNIEIRANLSPDLAMVRADPIQVEQVLINLCINARDAMPERGSLLVETSNVTLDEGFCALQTWAHPGDYVMLSVSDTGTGMDAATLERIFEPFFTTKEPDKGTGLGLATAYGIVRQHGGFMHVCSEPRMGSTFRIYFPVSSVATLKNSPA
jgi:two-component system, cell cycle sensor histidine kinase and response regulator CckA